MPTARRTLMVAVCGGRIAAQSTGLCIRRARLLRRRRGVGRAGRPQGRKHRQQDEQQGDSQSHWD